MRKLESLEAWVRSRELSRRAYRLTLAPPLSRHFSLADQIRRAATAIPANIAEGYALSTTPQFIRCLRIALGSATQLQTHLDLAGEMELIRANERAEAAALCDQVIGLLIGLIRHLQRRDGNTLPCSPFPLPR